MRLTVSSLFLHPVMNERIDQVFVFGPFAVDGRKRLLFRDGKAMSLTPKVFDTLLVLVEHEGRVVDKTTLMSCVWPDTIVEEGGLTRNISVLRKKLGEAPDDHRYIVTVPGRGYRFVAPVERVAVNGNGRVEEEWGATGAETARDRSEKANTGPQLYAEDRRVADAIAARFDAAAPVYRPRHAGGVLLAMAVLVTLTTAAAMYVLTRPGSTSKAHDLAGTMKVLAVLPLKPIDSENRDPIFELAIAESLILKLSANYSINVRPFSAVRRHVELDSDPIEAGRELKADYVLSSNYQIVNGRIRVTSQLFNVSTGQAEDSFKAESDAADAFSMQDTVANDIGNAMFAWVGQTKTTFTAKRGTENEEAYRLYLQGQYLVDKKTQRDAERAIEIFDAALKLDPNYARAWAGKAAAHCTFAHMGGIEPRLGFEHAKPALARAFELDPNMAEGHAVLGIISFDYDWDFEKGLAHFRKALELDPKHEMARRWYAIRLAVLGRHDEALTEVKTVMDINPSSIFHQLEYASILYHSRRYDEAIPQLHRVLEMDPNMTWADNKIWVSYHLKGDYEQAYVWFRKFQEKSKADPADIESYQRAHATSGWNGVLAKNLELLRAGYKTDRHDPKCWPGLLLASLSGDKEAALKFASDGFRNRDLWIPFMLHDPAFEVARKDPRFGELVRNAGL